MSFYSTSRFTTLPNAILLKSNMRIGVQRYGENLKVKNKKRNFCTCRLSHPNHHQKKHPRLVGIHLTQAGTIYFFVYSFVPSYY
jgi:hypothetical protein